MSRTVNEGGHVPVLSGNLARSVLMQLGAPVMTVSEDKDFSVQADTSAVLLGMTGDETVYLGWQARYAKRQNYGFTGEDALGRTYNQAGRGFLEAAVAKWPSIVADATAKVMSRSAK